MQSLDSQKLNAILTSPEMCFEQPEFRKWLRSEATGKRILAVIVDEAHCASQWGGDFRPHYALLDKLRMLLPVGTPVLATSATLNAEALKDVCTGLNLDLDESFFLNLGNDRPNITPSVVHMKSSRDYGAVDAQLPDPATIHTPADMPKTMVFTNAIKKTQILCRHIRQLFPNLPRHSIDFLHAHRTAKAKRRIMKQFRKGKIKILVATEAAGMVSSIKAALVILTRPIQGPDIPDVELVIQFGVPPSLPVWIQRYGRAGRCFDIQARAVMLVEKSMFQRKKPRKGGTAPAPAEPELGAHSDSDSSSDESDAEVAAGKSVPKKADAASVDLNDGRVWGKNVDPVLREYISTALCRRDIADKHFNNPPRRGKSFLSFGHMRLTFL